MGKLKGEGDASGGRRRAASGRGGGRHAAPRMLGSGGRVGRGKPPAMPNVPGGARKRRAREGGYILLDVLVALFIILVGFAVLVGSISLAASMTVKQNARVLALIAQRNTDAKERTILFQHK